jgi:hypothetical protein
MKLSLQNDVKPKNLLMEINYSAVLDYRRKKIKAK